MRTWTLGRPTVRVWGAFAAMCCGRLWGWAPPCGRIERLDDGLVRIGMKRVWSGGTSGIELSLVDLVEKLALSSPLPPERGEPASPPRQGIESSAADGAPATALRAAHAQPPAPPRSFPNAHPRLQHSPRSRHQRLLYSRPRPADVGATDPLARGGRPPHFGPFQRSPQSAGWRTRPAMPRPSPSESAAAVPHASRRPRSLARRSDVPRPALLWDQAWW